MGFNALGYNSLLVRLSSTAAEKLIARPPPPPPPPPPRKTIFNLFFSNYILKIQMQKIIISKNYNIYNNPKKNKVELWSNFGRTLVEVLVEVCTFVDTVLQKQSSTPRGRSLTLVELWSNFVEVFFSFF